MGMSLQFPKSFPRWFVPKRRFHIRSHGSVFLIRQTVSNKCCIASYHVEQFPAYAGMAAWAEPIFQRNLQDVHYFRGDTQKPEAVNKPTDSKNVIWKSIGIEVDASGYIKIEIMMVENIQSSPDHSCSPRGGLMQGWESECGGRDSFNWKYNQLHFKFV